MTWWTEREMSTEGLPEASVVFPVAAATISMVHWCVLAVAVRLLFAHHMK